MKFARFEVRLDYLLTSHQEGWQINSLCNPAVDAVKPLFLALESSFIYMPVNGDELVAAARVEFARTGISCPAEFFSAPIQYFVNSQLHYTANRAIAGRWPVEREVRYSANSKHTADVRIAVSADKHTETHRRPRCRSKKFTMTRYTSFDSGISGSMKNACHMPSHTCSSVSTPRFVRAA